ncbi:MAG: carboxypeptidase-like regulatory domain-containing protein [Bryobacteraceae bacterium]
MLRVWVGFAICLCFTSSHVALAQSNFATFGGSVIDTQSRPVADARVDVRSTANGLARAALTNSAGLFDLPGWGFR